MTRHKLSFGFLFLVLRKEKRQTNVLRLMRPYGARPKTMWIRESGAKGYHKEDFAEAFGRYIPESQAKAPLEEVVVAAAPPKVEEGSGEDQEGRQQG